MNTKNKGLDREMIIGCAIVAMLISISLIFLVVLYYEIDLASINKGSFVGLFSVLTGGIWGILLIRNC